MNPAQTRPAPPPGAAGGAPHNIELRHLRYFVALADAGSFTQAAEQMFIAQPTLSQAIRRLEEIVGARLLHRERTTPDARARRMGPVSRRPRPSGKAGT